jgi:tRNA (guanine37-N1)-methyltransferase
MIIGESKISFNQSIICTFVKTTNYMRIDILSGVPELLESPLNHSIIKRAKENRIVDIIIHNLRDFSRDKHRKIDDYAFGGEAGMVLSVEPIDLAIHTLQKERKYDEILYTSPDGELFTQKLANEISSKQNLIILCGHYKGVDQRVREHLITREISIGDYVLSGGELAASVIIDSIIRLIPGVLSDETSALTDSYQDGLLAPPVYTRPAVYKGWNVPEILLSGNAAEIDKWRMEESLRRTKKLRPELFKKLR